MPWVEGDRSSIVAALQLDMRADLPLGILEQLMQQMTIYAPARIIEVQELLVKIRDLSVLEDEITPEALAVGMLKQEESTLFGSVTYQDNHRRLLDDARREKMRSFRQRIRRYLDPCGYLARYNGVGRAIDGV